MTGAAARAVHACRACGGGLTIAFCDLGAQPLANAYLRPEDLGQPEPVYPLSVRVCAECRLAQLDHVVDASAIFSDYAYLSSVSSGWLAHARGFCKAMTQRLNLGPGSFVVEAASNDGYLLRNFVAAGVPCLGVEPAANVAKIAIDAGVDTRAVFFERETAAALVAERGFADLVVANNVLAHVPDVNDFVAGMALLAGPSGVVSVEAPHLARLVEGVQFDTIYHEHYAYWSLLAAEKLFARHGLRVFDVERLPTHGGSLRILASRDQRATGPGRDLVRAEEAALGMDSAPYYEGFESRVGEVLRAFRLYLNQAKREGRRVAAYGAAAKGNTFLNAADVDHGDLLMVADANPLKQGLYLPGSHIPIVSPQTLVEARPDDIVILPWNIATEVRRDLTAAGWRGRFVTAVPSLNVTQAAA